MAQAKGLTPMMKQYHALRQELPSDVLLFYRLGDFYELFFDDAKEAAGILEVALTKRNSVPMCGVPFHAAEGYIGKLITAGKRVALAEQVGEVTPGKIVRREIAQIISAGTVDDLNLLDSARPNYLAAVHFEKKGGFGLASLDHTTGEFRVAEFAEESALLDELARLSPAETLFSDERAERFAMLTQPHGGIAFDGYSFLADHAQLALTEHFAVKSLDGFGCAGMGPGLGAAGAILHYVLEQLQRSADHVRRLQPYSPEGHVLIDAASQRNLDLVPGPGDPRDKPTLLRCLDRTSTPMGARKLRHWILHPLRELEPLLARQDLVAALVGNAWLLEKLAEELKEIRDVERTSGRLSQGSGNARDLRVLGTSLARIPSLREHLAALGETSLGPGLLSRLHELREVVDLIETSIAEEPPAHLRDGGIFRDGAMAELDELRGASTEGKQWLADLQTRESEATGIKSLKVKYNAVFGYFLEVTKAHLELVPDAWTRKQTTANAERYFTPELKEMEDKILGADERAKALEKEAFQQLRMQVLEHLAGIQECAEALAEIDVLRSLAETARLHDYCRPVLDDSLVLDFRDGRHPVLDQELVEERFVPNDSVLDGGSARLMILTGPNMAGKSTYIRQVALLSLMAQIGSFVPASSAHLGLVDRIFTRVGASDDLAKGQSTFMVEMNETAHIVNNATERSLVILDEIGRGTSTFDGLSIAWSVSEHLHDKIRARTLFATHYHELVALATGRDGVINCNVAVREWNDQVVFLRKIVEGGADKSYGIQVARLAGLPQPIINRAKTILNHLEGTALQPGAESGDGGKPTQPRSRAAPRPVKDDAGQGQLGLFD